MNEAYYPLVLLFLILIPLFVLTYSVIYLAKNCETLPSMTAFQLAIAGQCW